MRITRLMLSLCLAGAMASCNSEVFIEDFLPIPERVTVDCSGKTTIRFEAGNWDLLGVSKGGIHYQNETVRDLKGRLMGHGLPLEGGELAIVSFKGDYYDFNIEKRDSLTLDLVLNENLYNDSLVVAVEVGNQFERKTIDVAFAPSGKYQIDSVSYQWNAFVVADSASRYSHAYILDNTQSSKPTTQWIHPYSNYSAQRKVNFYSDGYWNFDLFEHYFGTPLPRVRIPDLVGGQLSLGKTEVEFGIQSHQLESGLDTNVKEEITVNAGEHRRTEIYYIREIYNGPYRVYASNPSTGKKQIFSGEISSERIIGYKIISYNIKEDENRQENN